MLPIQRKPSPIQSARSGRSDCSSHSQPCMQRQTSEPCMQRQTSGPRRPQSLLGTMRMPSVSQLSAARSGTGYRKNSLVLEPDLIVALENRVRAMESHTGIFDRRDGRQGSKTSPSAAVMRSDRGGSKESSPSVRNSSTSPTETRHRLHGNTPSDQCSHTRSNSRRPSKADGNLYPGLPLSSSEASYRLIPTEIVEEEMESEKPPRTSASGPSANGFERRRSERQAELPTWRLRGQEALQGLCFQTVMALLIISNALVIGLETDIKDFEYWDEIENAFLFCFLGELLLKALFLGFCELFDKENPDFNWNTFDTFIVSLGLVDFIVGFFETGKKGGGIATLFRIIRLLRILRIIRIVKFLKQLYLLAFGLAEAAQAVFWVTILMTFILYVCSIIMVKTIGRPADTDPNQEFLNYHYGGVLKSMLSLFVLMSSPNLPVYQDQAGLLEDRPFLALFLVGFIIFGSFGMVALLTGVISESMFEKNDMRKEEERVEHEKLRGDVQKRCQELYEKFEKNEDDEVSIEDIKSPEMVDDMAKTFETAGVFVTAYELRTMLEYLDLDESGTINEDEFMRGMLVLAEGLRPITVQEVHHNVGVCRVKIERIEEAVETMTALVRGEAPGAPPPSIAASVDESPAARLGTFSEVAERANSRRTEASRQSPLEHLSDQIQDMIKSQKQMCKGFEELDGRVRELSRQVHQSPLGEDLASLKAHLSTSLQELGQHIIQQYSKERLYSSSRWTDAKFGVPMETRSQASYALSTTREPSPRIGHESTWPSLSFSAGGSTADQLPGALPGATTSAAAGVEQKFFTFDLDQLERPTRHQTDDLCSRGDVADVVIEAARQPRAAAAPSTAVSTTANTSAVVSLANPSGGPLTGDLVGNLPQGPPSRATARSADISMSHSQTSLVVDQVRELISLQQRVAAELQRATQQAQQEAAAQAAQLEQPMAISQMAKPMLAAQGAQATHATQATQEQQRPQSPSAAPVVLSPSVARAGPLEAVPTTHSLQPGPGQLPASPAATAPLEEPARHVSHTAMHNAASLAELLKRMHELVSNHEALQRLSVNASADGETSRSIEVLDCDFQPLGVPGA